MTNTFEPKLYILMRNDMASLNPGKAVAQGSHATSRFHEDIHALGTHKKTLLEAFKKWKEYRSFGTTIVCEGSHKAITSILDNCDSTIMHSIIEDPTYPLKDGDSFHYFSVETCAYIFCDSHATAQKLYGIKTFNCLKLMK